MWCIVVVARKEHQEWAVDGAGGLRGHDPREGVPKWGSMRGGDACEGGHRGLYGATTLVTGMPQWGSV